MLLSWANGRAARTTLGFGTLGPTLAYAAVSGVERNPNTGVTFSIAAWGPVLADFALWAARLLESTKKSGGIAPGQVLSGVPGSV